MGLREPADGLQRGLEPADRLRVRRARNRALADLLVVHLGLEPHFAAQSVVGELVGPVREPVDPGGEDGLDGRGHLEVLETPRQAVGAALADEYLGFGERANDLLEEVRVTAAPLDQEASERR